MSLSSHDIVPMDCDIIEDIPISENDNSTIVGFVPFRKDLQPSVYDHNNEYSQKILRMFCQNLPELYNRCNPQFSYSRNSNPRRILTKPAERVSNDSNDNKHADLILCVNDILQADGADASDHHHYIVLDLLGQGTFGQVVKCLNEKTKEHVGIKVIKNKPAYFNQALTEIKILKMLNEQSDPNDEHHIVRLLQYFVHKKHLCLVFELLNMNLYELIKQNLFRGLSCNLIRTFLRQILSSLKVLRDTHVIHCDLKPENILLKNLISPDVKLIDFGSACFEFQTVYSYIQSRFYRSPEVLLGLNYNSCIDMWSLGCIAAELFLGLPLYPGVNELNQLARIIEMQGQPPLKTLQKGKAVSKLFHIKEITLSDGSIESRYTLRTPEEYALATHSKVLPSKRYFSATNLHDLITTYPFRKNISIAEKEQEMQNRLWFVDFLEGVLNWEPQKRWTPLQAIKHPFITGRPIEGKYIPDLDPRPELQFLPKNEPICIPGYVAPVPPYVSIPHSQAYKRHRHKRQHRYHRSSLPNASQIKPPSSLPQVQQHYQQLIQRSGKIHGLRTQARALHHQEKQRQKEAQHPSSLTKTRTRTSLQHSTTSTELECDTHPNDQYLQV